MKTFPRVFTKKQACEITQISDTEYDYFTQHKRGKHNSVLLNVSKGKEPGPGHRAFLDVDHLVDLTILKLLKSSGMKLSKMGKLINQKNDKITFTNEDESLSLCIYRDKIKQKLMAVLS